MAEQPIFQTTPSRPLGYWMVRAAFLGVQASLCWGMAFAAAGHSILFSAGWTLLAFFNVLLMGHPSDVD